MKKTNSLLARLVTLVLMICLVFSLAIVVSTAAEEPATLSFADKANRTEFSGTKQVWYQNGITFTNNKGSSTNAVADYSPVRLYAGSNVVIDAPGNITKIVFTTSGSSYATPLKNSIGSAATVTVSGSEVTVTPNGTSESFTVAKLTAQVRLNSITVTYESGGCAHPNTKEEITKQADCTTDGSKTVTCTSCGETKVETVSATGHAGGEPSCTALAKCGTCGEEYGKLLPHNFEDGRCDVCGAEMPLEATISFANADQRQSLSTTQQVWKADGIVFTHNKSASTTNIADYTAPARFYKSSQIIIEGESSISKIVFNAPSGDYGPNKWQDSIGNVDGATVTVDGNDVIVEFRTPVMSFEIAAMSAQGRLNYITVTFVKDESQPEAPSYETNASVMLGKDLAMIYDVVVPAGTPTMVIEFANETVTLNGTSNGDGTYTFIFDGIGPHQMAEIIKATLYVDGVEVKVYDDYSINVNLKNIKDNYPGATALAEAALAYGKAAAAFQSEDPAAAPDLSGVTIDEKLVQQPIVSQNPDVASLAKFTSAGVYFDVTNKIYVKFIATEGCTVTVNGEEIDLTTLKCVNGTYQYYTDEITAVEFDEEFTFVIKDAGGNEITTLTYSVNAYAAAMQYSTDGITAPLVKALYLYGQEALKYKNPNGGNK